MPLLWDLQSNQAVSNESADIIRMLNSAFDQVGATAGNYAPSALHARLEQVNHFVYDKINNGVIIN